jgi:hypothetical protein
MFYSGKVYKNRYGVEYVFSKLFEDTYLFKMPELDYCRYGGKEGQEKMDLNDLGMFDPSGGPYVALGTVVDGREIVRIKSSALGFVVEVE